MTSIIGAISGFLAAHPNFLYGIAYAVLNEIVALLPIKANSLPQLVVMGVMGDLKQKAGK